MMQLSTEEGKDLDHLMNCLLRLPETHKSNVIQLEVAQKYFLAEKGQYYIVDLVYKALSHEPRVIITEKQVGIRTVIWPTPLLIDFLRSGGFSKIAEKQAHLSRQKEEVERLNLEKLKYDVKNSKRIFRTYWITFWMAIVGFLISLTLAILKIKTGK